MYQRDSSLSTPEVIKFNSEGGLSSEKSKNSKQDYKRAVNYDSRSRHRRVLGCMAPLPTFCIAYIRHIVSVAHFVVSIFIEFRVKRFSSNTRLAAHCVRSSHLAAPPIRIEA